MSIGYSFGKYVWDTYLLKYTSTCMFHLILQWRKTQEKFGLGNISAVKEKKSKTWYQNVNLTAQKCTIQRAKTYYEWMLWKMYHKQHRYIKTVIEF